MNLERIRVHRPSIREIAWVMTVVGLGVALVLGVALIVSVHYRSEARAYVATEISEIEFLHQAQTASLAEGANLAGYYALPNTEYAAKFRTQATAVDTALAQNLDLAQRTGQVDELPILQGMLSEHKATHALQEQILEALQRGDPAAAFVIAQDNNLANRIERFNDGLLAAETAAHGQLTAADESEAALQSRVTRVSVGIVVLWILIVLATSFTAFRWFVWPIEAVSRMSKAVAGGDLRSKIPAAGPREIASMSSDVNEMARVLVENTDQLRAYLEKDLEEQAARLQETNVALNHSEARFRALVQNAATLITVVTPDTTVIYASPATASIFGLSESAFERLKLSELVHPADLAGFLGFMKAMMAGTATQTTSRFQLADGSSCSLDIIGTDQRQEPAIAGIVFNLRDVTEKVALEAELKHQAFHDPLTSLANRASFADRLDHALSRGRRAGSGLAVLFLDLDKFKGVNDQLGHPAGDQLLIHAGRKLAASVRAGDTVARFGGDEFAILLEDLAGLETATETASRILTDLREPVQIEGVAIVPRASIGIAYAERAESSAEDLLRDADIALYVAKDRGRDRFEVFNANLRAAMLERLQILGELEGAVERGEFFIEYQPTVSLRTGRIVGAEALVRWHHPKRGILQPDEFISLAEESGAIFELGHWVLSRACEQARVWQDIKGHGEELFMMGINVSVRQLAQPDFVSVVRDVLVETGVDPAGIVLEVTESAMMRDAGEAAAVLGMLKQLGIRLALDDFGMGYSSLSYLRQLPFDMLKIDKSFVGANDTDHLHDEELEKVIVELAKTLHLEIVAEGIERKEQLLRLQDLTCEFGQGFYFGKPVLPGAMDALIRKDRLPQVA